MSDLREWLEFVEREFPQQVVRIRQPIDPVYEAHAVVEHYERGTDPPIIVFENLKGYQGWKAVVNVHATRDRIARSIGVQKEHLAEAWVQRTSNPVAPVVVDSSQAPVHQIVWEGDEADVTRLPHFTHYQQDAGPYISAGVHVAVDPDTNVYNYSIHRCQVVGPKEIRTSLHTRRHLWDYQRRAEAQGKPLEVALVIGHHPALYLAGVAMDPIEVDESHLMGAFLGRPVRLVKARTVDLLVPADAEIVIEGEYPPNERAPEGPFGEFTGFVSRRSTNHVIRVKAITMRRGAIYQDIACGFSAEHSLLGAIPREPNLLKAVRVLSPTVKNVCYPVSGTCRFHAYISVKKTKEGEGKNIIMAAFGADHYLKMVVVVDDDIDVFNDKEVLWAMSTRLQAANGVMIVAKGAAALLDPSSVNGMSDKMGIDATKPLEGWVAERPTLPKEIQTHIDERLRSGALAAVPAR